MRKAVDYMPAGMTVQQMRTARELYRDGWTLERVGKLFGVPKQAIHRMLKVRGIPTRPRHPVAGRHGDGSVRRDKEEGGVIVTLRRQSDGALAPIHRAGLRGAALREIAEYVDGLPEDWRVFCYSTSATIYSDMQGARIANDRRGNAVVGSPEATALSTIGRLDLLDPALVR